MVNGERTLIVMFSGLLVCAVVDRMLINRMEHIWVPPAAGPVVNDVIYVTLSAVLFGVIVTIHGWLGYPQLG